ncbi:MAG: hypothetical protein ABSF36_07085 [Candidatus Methanomethylicaceae archaeon]
MPSQKSRKDHLKKMFANSPLCQPQKKNTAMDKQGVSEKLKNPFRSRFSLIVGGVLAGACPSGYFLILGNSSILYEITLSLVVVFTVIFCFSSWNYATWNNGKKLSGVSKSRLLFFGVSLASFGSALIDVVLYLFVYTNTITWGSAGILLGGIPFGSVLFSLAVGGLFTLMEHYFEVVENKDL